MERTSRIALLDDNTVNRIAAGEVVERPASVVKELVENSLDAGARRILIQVEEGGKKLIRIVDDGIGMNPDEAQLALQRHATSKISKAEDLFNIQTLGFRGEGLPSIASVSILEMLTRARTDHEGYKAVVHGGTIVEAGASGSAPGTSISVRDLFFNTPARLKFMKSSATEMSHIVELISKYAMAYPEVSFRLQQNGQDMIVSPGAGDALGALASVWGKEVARGLAALDTVYSGIRVRGFISPPHITRPTRGYQAFFVNHRPVRTRTLTAALDEAYRALTPEKRYPIALLMLEVDPAKVDVNVHPAKTEVKFQREGDIYAAVNQAVKEGLSRHGMMPEAFRTSHPRPQPAVWNMPSSSAPASHPPLAASSGSGAASAPAQTLQTPRFDANAVAPAIQAFEPIAPPALKIAPNFADVSFNDPSDPFGATLPFEPILETPPESNALPFADLLDGLRVIGQARNTYIICETAKGVVLIDQHVAHERVLYEKFCGIKGQTPIEMQHLLTPIAIPLDKRAALLLEEKLDEINKLGFELELFGSDTFLLRAVPAALAHKNYESALKDIIDELVDTSVARRLPVAREQIWITASCKQAVKAGDPLTMGEMEALIRQLAETENPYLCPHGRPITITMTNDEIDRKFKRT